MRTPRLGRQFDIVTDARFLKSAGKVTKPDKITFKLYCVQTSLQALHEQLSRLSILRHILLQSSVDAFIDRATILCCFHAKVSLMIDLLFLLFL